MKLIGIICRLETLQGQQKWFVNASYIKAFEKYNCALFPILSYASLQTASSLCDALIIPGGYDLRSYYLNEMPHETCTFYHDAQDHFDFSCISAFLEKAKPILGICRGMQMLACYFNSTMIQNLDTTLHAPDHKHALQLPKESILLQLMKDGSVVNSYHHQVVVQCAPCLDVLAMSADNHIEAFQHHKLPILAVQWHPEIAEDDQILPYFLDVVCARSLRRL